MEDLFVSLQSREEGADVKAELIALLAKSCFKLTKWATNFDEDEVHDKALTILGLEWNNKTDTLKVCRGLQFKPENNWTQQKVLSIVCSVFDPLGFLAPFVIHGIWQTRGQQWDSVIDEKEHSIHFHKVFMWSDSTTVIQWIRSSNEKRPTFVANRVAEILDTSTVDVWHHEEGAKKPADLGTRGLIFDDIANSN